MSTYNFYFGGDDEDNESVEEVTQPAFLPFLFNIAKIALFIGGILYVLSFFPQFKDYYIFTTRPTGRLRQENRLVIEESELDRQNREINQERERFYDRTRKSKR